VRVLITGSRDWDDWETLNAALLAEVDGGHLSVVHGGARGADQMAGAWARKHGLTEEVFPAQWSTHGRRAGFVRNAQMVDTMPDVCLAFIRNGSRGATMTADLAEAAGIPTRRYTQEATS
jgi:hypothetical protein